jgi:hypothetical protein
MRILSINHLLTMKHLLTSICALALILTGCSKQDDQPFHPTNLTELRFLELCTGVSIVSRGSQDIAYANCLGRVRGFIDGHAMTVVANPDIEPLWCVNQMQPDIEVYNEIVDWVVKNPVKYKSIAAAAPPATASMMVAIAAAHERFPCKDE